MDCTYYYDRSADLPLVYYILRVTNHFEELNFTAFEIMECQQGHSAFINQCTVCDPHF